MMRVCFCLMLDLLISLLVQCQEKYRAPGDMSDILSAIWGKRITYQYLDDDALGHVYLAITIPDGDVASLPQPLSIYCANIAVIYKKTVLEPKHLRADSASVYLFRESNNKDPFDGYKVHFPAIPAGDSMAVNLTKALLSVCPGSKYYFMSFDNLIAVFQSPTAIDSLEGERNKRRSYLIDGICAKYFFGSQSGIQKMTLVWLDPGGVPYANAMIIDDKKFVDWYNANIGL